MTLRPKNVVLWLVLIALAALLLDLGGIRTDLLAGLRAGWNEARRD